MRSLINAIPFVGAGAALHFGLGPAYNVGGILGQVGYVFLVLLGVALSIEFVFKRWAK